MKQIIIDNVLKEARIKEAGMIDFIKSLASKFHINIPTKQEAFKKNEEFLHNNKSAVDDAIKYYNTILEKKSNIIEAGIFNKNTILIIIALFIAFGQIPSNAQEVDTMLKQQQVVEDYLSPMVNLNDFQSIRDGMSHAQVARILGSQGKKIDDAHSFTTYQWNNDFNSVTIKFQRDKVVQKSQIGMDRPSDYEGREGN